MLIKSEEDQPYNQECTVDFGSAVTVKYLIFSVRYGDDCRNSLLWPVANIDFLGAQPDVFSHGMVNQWVEQIDADIFSLESAGAGNSTKDDTCTGKRFCSKQSDIVVGLDERSMLKIDFALDSASRRSASLPSALSFM